MLTKLGCDFVVRVISKAYLTSVIKTQNNMLINSEEEICLCQLSILKPHRF